MKPSTIGGINQLPEEEKRRIYCGLIPRELLEHFHLPRNRRAAIRLIYPISICARFQQRGNVAVS